MAQFLKTWQHDIPCMVNFMAQIPVMVDQSCVLLRQIPSRRICVTRDWALPYKNEAFFSWRDRANGKSRVVIAYHEYICTTLWPSSCHLPCRVCNKCKTQLHYLGSSGSARKCCWLEEGRHPLHFARRTLNSLGSRIHPPGCSFLCSGYVSRSRIHRYSRWKAQATGVWEIRWWRWLWIRALGCGVFWLVRKGGGSIPERLWRRRTCRWLCIQRCFYKDRSSRAELRFVLG